MIDPHSSRRSELHDFVAAHFPRGDFTLAPASADASFRSYWRVDGGGETRVVMDAPPDKEDIAPWLDIGARLREAGLHTPQVFAVDQARGFILMEDLGNRTYLPELNAASADALYGDALDALDADETSHYINHRLARAALGTPMEFPREVTDRIHTRSGGVPRLINVIADATLVFGYGEERSEIDKALIEEVITDLDATGVLGPRSNPNRHESVVPPTAPIATAPVRQEQAMHSTPNAAADRARTAEDEKLRRELADLERSLKKREHDMTLRERELAEQRRVLADQFRLLKTQTQPQAAGAAAWPPAGGTKPPACGSRSRSGPSPTTTSGSPSAAAASVAIPFSGERRPT